MKKLILFKAEWCGPCKSSHASWLSFKKQNVDKFEFSEYDIDESQDFTNKYNIMSVPTIIYEIDGKIVDKYIGGYSFNTLMKLVG